MLKIHEFSTADGALSSLFLRVLGGRLEIVSDEATWSVPYGALDAVLTRYGAPFDAAARSTLIASLDVGEGASLRHVRHLAGYDVIARDYLVYQREDGETLCALAATVAAALLHLGRAQAARS